MIQGPAAGIDDQLIGDVGSPFAAGVALPPRQATRFAYAQGLD